MTAADILAAMRRRWYVVALGVGWTAVGCLVVAASPGAYWAQVDVVFLAPQSARNPNTLEITSQSLISTAGVVAKRVNQGRDETALSSSSVSLVGEGITEGHSVRLPNAGGQWADNYTRPVLDVQAVGGTPEAARETLDTLVAEVRQTLDELQIQGGADRFNRIVAEPAPSSPVVHHIGTQRARAMLGTAALGGALTLGAVVLIDRAALGRRSAQPGTRATVAARRGGSARSPHRWAEG